MRRFTTLFTTTLFVAALSTTAYASTEACSSALLEAPIDQLQQLLRINNVQAARIQVIRHDLGRQHAELEARVDPYYLANRLEAVSLRALSQVKSVLAPWQLARCNSQAYYEPAPRVAYVHPAPRRIVRRTPMRIVRRAPKRIVRPAPKRIVRPAPKRIVRRPAKVVHRAPAPHRAVKHTAPTRHRAPAATQPRPAPKKSHNSAPKHKRSHR